MKRALILTCLSLTLLLPCCAQARTLTLAEAVQTALTHSPEVAAADQEVAVTRTKLAQVQSHARLHAGLQLSSVHLNEIPSLTVDPLTLNLGALGSLTVALPSFALSRQDITQATLFAQLPLSTGGRVEHGLEQVRARIAAQEAAADSKRREVAYATVQAYLSAVLAERVALVTEEAYATMQQHEAQAEAVVKAGSAAKYELIRAQTEVANQDRRRLDAHNQANLARAYLQAVMGTEQGESLDLTTGLTGDQPFAQDLAGATQAAETASTDLKALAARDRLYQAGEKSAQAEMHPAIAAVMTQELYRRDLPVTTPEGFVGVVAQVPLLDGGLAKAEAAEQAALRARNQSDVRRVTDGLQLEVRKHLLDLTSARTALTASDQAVVLAKEALRLATRRFDVGEGTGMEKSDALLALSLAETNRAQAQYQYDVAYYGLKKAMGELLPELVSQKVK